MAVQWQRSSIKLAVFFCKLSLRGRLKVRVM